MCVCKHLFQRWDLGEGAYHYFTCLLFQLQTSSNKDAIFIVESSLVKFERFEYLFRRHGRSQCCGPCL